MSNTLDFKNNVPLLTTWNETFLFLTLKDYYTVCRKMSFYLTSSYYSLSVLLISFCFLALVFGFITLIQTYLRPRGVHPLIVHRHPHDRSESIVSRTQNYWCSFPLPWKTMLVRSITLTYSVLKILIRNVHNIILCDFNYILGVFLM